MTQAGTTIGSYEVVALLGSGGMGEVYRARDARLGRDVALKILPTAFADDPDRLARFRREGQVLASLNHPNIAAIYGIEETQTVRAIIMELVEGPTLADRIAQGPVPVEETLAVARQIVHALEGAHEKSVVHRDLKPANVKITPEGVVKVLDFGLAKAFEHDTTSSHLTNSPTLSLAATQAGIILGTAAYMSPEQAKGAPADQRSDVFSFGCVLYEMLTGRQVFKADSAAETMAAVLMREPDLAALPATLNPKLVDLVRRCLAKSPKARWQAAGDLRIELESLAADPYGERAGRQGVLKPLWKRVLPIAATAAIAGAAATAVMWVTLRPNAPQNVTRFPVPLAEGQAFSGIASRMLALSPDGTRLAYVANNQLFLRALADLEAQPVPGTAGLSPTDPVFSPDGQWIGFYSIVDPSLKKIATTGGAPLTLHRFGRASSVGLFQSPSWSGDDILFVQQGAGILRVAANGGEPQVLVRLDGDQMAYGPQLLPDGRGLLFSLATETGSDRWDKAQVVVQALPGGERKVVVPGGGAGQYLPSGHLAYMLGGTLLAVSFDLDRLEARGTPVPLLEGVRRGSTMAISGAAQFAASPAGTLAYVPGLLSYESLTLALVDRAGVAQTLLPPQAYQHPRISPDGRSVVFGTDDAREAIVWVAELKPGAPARRLTFGGRNLYPIWSRVGSFIVFQSDREGDRGLFRQPADGSGTAERLTKPEGAGDHRPDGWTADGRTLIFTAVTGNTDVWLLPLDGDQQPKPLIQRIGSGERQAAVSMDGRWIAYSSNEIGGRYEVFVQPLPITGAKYQISTEGGREPRWAPDGTHLIYNANVAGGRENRFIEVEVTTQPTFSFGGRMPIRVDGSVQGSTNVARHYDVTPDGKQLLVLRPPGEGPDSSRPRPEQIHVVLNWFEELRARVPTQ